MNAKFKNIYFIFLIIFFISSCKKELGKLIEIQHVIGDYKISILYDPNSFKQGSGSFFLEFRIASNNELINVENLSTNAAMQMGGQSMSGETSVIPTGTSDRYEVKYNFMMKGDWLFDVNLENGMHTQFMLSVN